MKHVSLASIERAQLIRDEAREKARAEDRWIEAARAETLALAALRAEPIEAPKAGRGERRKPMRRKSGLDWLADKGRLSKTQKAAGERYGVDYRLGEEVRLRSALNDTVVGYTDGPTGVAGAARVRLANARKALGDHKAMIGVCNAVCGIGLTLREFTAARRDAEVAETRLLIALDLLAGHYGLS